jgi:diphthine-ammonia ligase
MISIKNSQFFCSWSGGKDSCLALYHAITNAGKPKCLLTMFAEDGKSRSHGLPLSVLQTQAASLDIPLVVRNTSWADYEANFLSSIRGFKESGIEYGVFGDIDLEAHLEWVTRVCGTVKIRVYEPLWKRNRRELLNEFLDLGFRATIVSVKLEALPISFLGRNLSREVITDLERAGVDASGEGGEYHTVVTDGPIFSKSIRLKKQGEFSHNGYCFLEVDLEDGERYLRWYTLPPWRFRHFP